MYIFFPPVTLPRAGQGLLLAGLPLLHRARMIGGLIAPDADILHSQAAVATAGGLLLLGAVVMAGLRPRAAR